MNSNQPLTTNTQSNSAAITLVSAINSPRDMDNLPSTDILLTRRRIFSETPVSATPLRTINGALMV